MLLQILLILLFCTAAYALWLDQRVRTEFEGKKWSLPARVYASPLELYSGLRMDLFTLEHQLNVAGYQRVTRPSRPGDYSREGQTLIIHSRAFEFWDGAEEAREFSVSFGGGAINTLTLTASGESQALIRLEPVLIGKITPEHEEDRILIAYDEIPPHLIDALIAVEDRSYFEHSGIDPRGILRAAWTNLRSGKVRQGGSTLTQQLVKNFFLTHERTLWRKLNEMIMALLLERHYSKAEILGAYVNEVYLGQHGAIAIHGFGTAAEYYFARPLNELRVDQLALLAGLVRGASYYNPRKHPERAEERRNLVIQQMSEQGYLIPAETESALKAPLDIAARPSWSNAKYPAYLDLVRRQLQADYNAEDLKTEGLRIFTTLNPVYQEAMVKAVSERLPMLEKMRELPDHSLEAAGVVSSVETGEVLAMIGGREDTGGGFNRALDAKRPIGSLVKPAVYLAALSQPEKYNVLSWLLDAPISIKQPDGTSWMPDNYDKETHGDVPLHVALENSYNLATVRLGLDAGIQAFISTFKALGVDQHIPEYPSVFLGTTELSPLQVAQMYQTLASNGFLIPLRAIRDVLDKDGNPLQRYPLDIRQTVDSRAVHILNSILTGVVERGTAKSLARRLPDLMPLAGKTGTTNDMRDSWFAGFGDNILGVIWLGRDDNTPAGLTGASGALQVWGDIMQAIKPLPLTLVPPEGVSWVPVLDSRRVPEGCPGAREYPFMVPYLPPAGSCTHFDRPVSPPQPSQPGDKQEKPWSIFDIFR